MTHTTSLQIRSLIRSSGELELSLMRVDVPAPALDEVIIQMHAAPINPSDLGLLFGAADLSTLQQSGTHDAPVLTAKLPPAALKSMASRLDQSMPAGNEGAGMVVAAGDAAEAQAMLGKTVALFGGPTFVQYRSAKAAQCVVLPAGATAADGASIFVNPMTALCMVDVMQREGRKALVHTAAASNLGQMLLRLCQKDQIPLVNIVRSEAQAELLRGMGAAHVCNSSAPGFTEDLTRALTATDATMAFDATGGGPLCNQILLCMEAALAAKPQQGEYSRYGTTTVKKIYAYGNLDNSPTVLTRNYGTAWAVAGWVLPNYLQEIGAEVTERLRARVLAELTSTFTSHYGQEISLTEALQLEQIAAYTKRGTGAKFLINPNKGYPVPA